MANASIFDQLNPAWIPRVKGRAGCFLCDGTGYTLIYSVKHHGYISDLCPSCHKEPPLYFSPEQYRNIQEKK